MKKIINLLNAIVFLSILTSSLNGYADSDPTCYFFSKIQMKQFQTLPVNNSRAWKAFAIDDRLYLAAAQFTDQYPSGNKDINSTVFQWDPKQGFKKFQSLLTHGARAVSFTSYYGKYFLVIANLQTNGKDAAAYNVSSVVYQWNGKQFEEIQKIPTDKAVDVQFMTIDRKLYLSFASIEAPQSKNPNIYRWDGKSFQAFQTIKQSKTFSILHFNAADKHFLALGNSEGPSFIYQWIKDKFIFLQEIPVSNVRGMTYFKDKGGDYLAIASQDANSSIYKWNQNRFVLFAQDKGPGGRSWAYLPYQGKSYLLLSHFIHDQPKGTNFNLTVYELEKQLTPIAQLPSSGIGQLMTMQRKNATYLLATKLFSDSVLYKLEKSRGCQN